MATLDPFLPPVFRRSVLSRLSLERRQIVRIRLAAKLSACLGTCDLAKRSFNVVRSEPAGPIRITGHGADDQTQQTHLSDLAGFDNDGVRYTTDTEGGLFANPATSTSTVRGLAPDADVQIFNMLGRAVLQTKLTEEIDIQQLSPGQYVLKSGGTEPVSFFKQR